MSINQALDLRLNSVNAVSFLSFVDFAENFEVHTGTVASSLMDPDERRRAHNDKRRESLRGVCGLPSGCLRG